MEEILKSVLMFFPEWLAVIFMVVGLCVTALAAVRLGYGLAVAKTVYKWIVIAEEKFGSGAGAEKKAHVIAVLCGYTPDWLDSDTWELVRAYSPDIAEQKYQAHLREIGPNLKIGKDHELANYIETTILDKECSPAAVFGYAQQEGREFKTSVSVQTVYHYIKKGLFLNITQKELPRHGKRKQQYKKVCEKEAARAPAGESIEQRPPEVNDREEFGHWEGDTVYSGKGKVKTTSALLTITERKTRNELIIGVPNRKAETIVRAMDALERKLGARKFRLIFKSITFDNGTEFAAADKLERSCINKTIPRTKVYYAHPYSSWERGSNEHVNGMIRRKHPKGTDFSKVTKEENAATEKWINEYPRKIFGYKSSAVMFKQCLDELGIVV